MILEYKDVQNFEVKTIANDGSITLKISGLAFHSALAAKEMKTEQAGKSLLIYINLVPMKKGLSGRFEYEIKVPDNVKKVVFGEKEHTIWSRM